MNFYVSINCAKDHVLQTKFLVSVLKEALHNGTEYILPCKSWQNRSSIMSSLSNKTLVWHMLRINL